MRAGKPVQAVLQGPSACMRTAVLTLGLLVFLTSRGAARHGVVVTRLLISFLLWQCERGQQFERDGTKMGPCGERMGLASCRAFGCGPLTTTTQMCRSTQQRQMKCHFSHMRYGHGRTSSLTITSWGRWSATVVGCGFGMSPELFTNCCCSGYAHTSRRAMPVKFMCS